MSEIVSLSVENFLLERARGQSDQYDSLAVLDRSGEVIAASEVGDIGKTVSIADLTPHVESDGRTHWGDLFADNAASRGVLNIAHPIVSRLSTEPIGWLVAGVRLEAVEHAHRELPEAPRRAVQRTFFLLVDHLARSSRAIDLERWPPVGRP